MSNPSKAKGTSAETKVVNWLRANGFPEAYRTSLSGAKDQGDIRLSSSIPVIGEVKWRCSTPTAGQIDEWLQQTITETANAEVATGFLIYNRPGSADVDKWTVLWPKRHRFVSLHRPDIATSTRMSGADLIQILHDIYGLEEREAA